MFSDRPASGLPQKFTRQLQMLSSLGQCYNLVLQLGSFIIWMIFSFGRGIAVPVCQRLSLPVTLQKVEGPAPTLCFLDNEFDAASQTFEMSSTLR